MPKPQLNAYREPYSRSSIEWSPTLIRSARLLADSGNLRLAADLCQDLLLDDAKVAGCLQQRILGGLGLPLSFDPDGDKRRKSRIEKAIETDFWRAYPESDLAQLESWGLLLGVGIARHAWIDGGEEHQGRWIPKLEVWHPRNLRWDFTLRQWRLTVNGGQEITIEPGDGEWLVYTPYGQNRPWAWAPWRRCALWSLAKSYGRSDWSRNSEVSGGIRSAKWAADKTPGDMLKDRKEIGQALSEVGREASVVPPPGWELYLLQLAQNSHKTFPELIETANAEIAVAITGQTLSSGTDSGGAGLGTGGAADLHKVVRQDLIEFDAQNRSTFLHDQSLIWWGLYNFGQKKLAPWPTWQTAPAKDLKTKAETLDKLGDALEKLKKHLPVDARQVAEEFELPLVEGAPVPGEDGEPVPTHVVPEEPKEEEDGGEVKETAQAEDTKQELSAALLSVQNRDGVMIALYPPPEVAQALVVPGGEPAEELHLTLCYLGRVSELSPEAISRAAEVCQMCAAETLPIEGQVSGIGRFSAAPSSDGLDVLWAAVDAPDLAACRERLAAALSSAGVPYKREHGFQPHMTLAYLKPEEVSPLTRLPVLRVDFGALCLVVGGQRQDFPLVPLEKRMVLSARPRRNPLIASRVFLDAVVDNAVKSDPEAKTLALVQKAIEASTSYDDLRAQLLVAFPEIDVQEFMQLLEGSTLIALSAGLWSAQEDRHA